MRKCPLKIYPFKSSKIFGVIVVVIFSIFLSSLSASTETTQNERFSHFPKVEIIVPRPEEKIDSKTPVILISLFDEDDDLNLETVTLKIDDTDVSCRAQISRTLISFVPKKPLKRGKHVIAVSVADSSKNRTGPVTWQFFVSPNPTRTERTSAIHGKIELKSNFNFFPQGKPTYYRPGDTQLLRLDLSKKYRDWSLAFSTIQRTHFHRQDRSIDNQYQPFNRYQLYLQRKNLKLHIGDGVPNFSPLTLSNTRIRGFSLQWSYKSFSTKFIQGQMYRAVIPLTSLQIPVFSRNVFAAAIGFRFFSAFKFTFNFIKFKENAGSSPLPDSIFSRFHPAENLVVSSRLEFLSTDRKTEFSAEAAHSVFIYNSECDQQKALFKGLKENIPPWLIKINDCYITTFSREPMENLAPRTYQLRLRRRFRYSNFSVKFSRIPLVFTTMGNQNLPLNSQQLQISSFSNLYANKILLSLGFTSGKNNLIPYLSAQTTNKKRVHFNINYAVNSSFSLRAGLQKFSQKTTKSLFSDNFTANNNLDLLNMGGSLRVSNHHQLFFNFFRSASNVQSESIAEYQSLSFSTRHNFKIPLTLAFGVDYTENKLRHDLSFKYTNFRWNIRYNIAASSCQLFFSGNISQIEEVSRVFHRRYYFSTGSTVRLKQGLSLIGRINYFTNDSGYSMCRVSLGIQETF